VEKEGLNARVKQKAAAEKKLHTVAVVLILALLYFVTGKLSLDLLLGHNIVNLGVFAPEGIALAFALYFGRKVWPGIFMGQLLLALVNGIALLPALEISAINATEALIAIALFERFHLDRAVKSFRDMIGLVMLIVFVLQPFSSLFSNFALLLHGQIESSQFGHSLFSWWFGNVMGQLLFAPFLLQLFLHYRKMRMGEYLLYGLGFALFLYMLEIKVAITNPFLLLSFTIPVLVFVVSYRGKLYGMLLSVVVATVSSYSVYKATGAFYFGGESENIINYNLFVLAHIMTVLVTGILFEERQQYEEGLHLLIEEEVEKNRAQQLFMLQQNRLAQMGEMINMIAHQWRQPLNHLSLLNQTLLYQYKKGKLDGEKMEGFVEKSAKTITQMSATIDDFRNFFRPDKHKVTFCINDVIDHVLEITAPLVTHYGIAVDVESPVPCYTYGFPNELGQGIMNILYNAKDALNERDISGKRIIISLHDEEERVSLSICDNAGGIPDEVFEHIFDPYFSTKENKNGTGLGLYISKIIVEDHMNGTLRVSNHNGTGACFTIILPAAKRAETA